MSNETKETNNEGHESIKQSVLRAVGWVKTPDSETREIEIRRVHDALSRPPYRITPIGGAMLDEATFVR